MPIMVNVQDHFALQSVSEGKHIRANNTPVETSPIIAR